MSQTSHNRHNSTVDPAEIERFSRIADEWWDPTGKFAPLHRLNPVRIGYIRDRAAAHWGREALSGQPLEGLSVLDIGCGGGLLSEPMARLGAAVTGVDASARNIAVASLHAERQGLAIDYRQDTAEALASSAAQFDVVLALEIVEHVADVDLFLQVLRPAGEARRADFRLDAQPHRQGLGAGHRRRRVRPGLAAARHARLEEIPEALRSRARPRSRRHHHQGDRGRGL